MGLGNLSPLMTMSVLIGNSFENSFLIDWKGKKSYFNDERFVKLLEMTQKDESKTSRDEKQQNDITWVSIMDYLSLIELMADYEQEGRIVGFPGQTMGTSVLVPQDGILVVNKNAKDTEAVKLFLETILSKEMINNNGTVGISVRKFQPQEYITTDDSSGKEMKYYSGKHDVDKIYGMDPEKNPILRAVSFLENCEPASNPYYPVKLIVSEEIQSMYAEGKDAKTTAEIINNRVQTYLNEQ